MIGRRVVRLFGPSGICKKKTRTNPILAIAAPRQKGRFASESVKAPIQKQATNTYANKTTIVDGTLDSPSGRLTTAEIAPKRTASQRLSSAKTAQENQSRENKGNDHVPKHPERMNYIPRLMPMSCKPRGRLRQNR